MQSSNLTVADAMTRDVITIGPDETLADAMSILADGHVSGLAVVDSRRRLIGVASTTDLLTAAAETSEDGRALVLATTTVGEVMSTRPLTVDPRTELREAALQMDYADVHRLFVERDGVLVGVVSRSDINRVYAAGRGG
jgi:CBS domain-containing protein